MPILSIIKVRGESLAPALRHGDFIVAGGGWLLGRLRPGQLVIFTHPSYGRMVKRLLSLSADGQTLFVVGDDPNSVDSRSFGPIPRSAVSARALWIVRKQRRTRTTRT